MRPTKPMIRRGHIIFLLSGFLAVCTFYRPNWLIEKYGPSLYSEKNEELIIRDFFQDRRGGYFVDVGSSHYRKNSTTYYLEKSLGWSGLAVDAECAYADDYRAFRPNSRFFCFLVGAESQKWMDFYSHIWNKRLSSGSANWAKRRGPSHGVKVLSITLNDLLSRVGITHFDFLSMDIELGEPAALAGFDIEKYRPDLVCIEAHTEIRQKILDYFDAHTYVIVRKYDGLDLLNLYFMPGPR